MSSNLLVISGLMLGVLVLCTVKFKIHPFFALIATTVTNGPRALSAVEENRGVIRGRGEPIEMLLGI